MPYKKVPDDHSEFGGGPGLIDPVLRKDRNVTPEQELLEIYATDPSDPQSDPALVNLETRAPRANRTPRDQRAGTT